jgi:hypothetical protein
VRRGRIVLISIAVVVLAAVLVGVGRWERTNRADEELAGMRRVQAAVGPLDNPTLSAFRYLGSFQCLLYRRGGNELALELCFTEDGRLVEAIDRRGNGDPKISSLRDDPAKATIRVDRGEVDRLLLRMGVPQRLIDAIHGQA